MSNNYKGFEIKSISEQLLETKKWNTSVEIVSHKGSHVVSKKFSADNIFDSKDEADKYSIIFGKQIIDGVHKDISISDLL